MHYACYHSMRYYSTVLNLSPNKHMYTSFSRPFTIIINYKYMLYTLIDSYEIMRNTISSRFPVDSITI